MPITFKPDMKNGDNKLLQKYEAAGKPEKRHSLLAHVETGYDLGKFEEKIVKHVISLANTNGTRWMTWGELCQTTSRGRDPDLAQAARRIQWVEMLLLLVHTAEAATS